MPDSAKERISQLPQSKLTAEQLLTILLELISDTHDVGQLTTEVIDDAFGIRLQPYEEDSFAYAGRLTKTWNVRVEVSDDEFYGPGVDVRFFDSEGGRRAPMSDICAVDSDTFSETLANAGFERQPYTGIHGGFAGEFLTRGAVRVTTSVRGEASQPEEKVTHSCITAVQVQRYDQ